MQNVSKRTILWIVPIIIIVIFWYFYGPKDEITDNEYISYIKEIKYNETEETLASAFELILQKNEQQSEEQRDTFLNNVITN
ncbi:hypothetical protein RhiirA1_485295 [Rhizophagus irregularis]|uniref:Uncharacterized protein n=1 Tax=Rhizophagus irregularis TaxID=588596 RepID=A0A2N0QID7_9GLOM|nr:hypothetical protein RhiirA1_485295 [Rhizophagus irregularis]